MQITSQYKINNYYKNKNYTKISLKSGYTIPSFGINLKPKILTDLFTKNKQDIPQCISIIKNVHPGEFGTECKGSIPLPDFEENFSIKELKRLYKIGYSTNIDAMANCFLKSSADKPLSTSSVYDCSVLYLYNKDKNTHFLYHTYHNADSKDFKFLISTFMPENFTNAYIIPGDAQWYVKHLNTMKEMLKALKASNKKATVNIYHDSSKLPEIVGYQGKVFEIPNLRTTQGFSDQGQASFKISDLQCYNTIWMIIKQLDTNKKIEISRKFFNNKNYDQEVLKIFNKLLDERENDIREIEACKTLEEIDNLIKSYPQEKTLRLFKALSRQKLKIKSDINLNK